MLQISFILRLFRALPWDRTALALLQGYNFIVLSATNDPDLSHQAATTVLTTALGPTTSARLHCGALTPPVFDGFASELDSLLHSAGVSDLGWRGKIVVTGGDRLRWLNGMVSNTVQSLPEGQGNYSLLLSVQGRIQGDCYVYRRAQDLILDTGIDQVPTLMQPPRSLRDNGRCGAGRR